ncbi:MAG: flagellar basal body-associated protein FliL [Sulfurimonas sp.]|uniref:flagellar basal body-associated protein FliL n=1 Tax=Sulfurimonas sp. TaxID=2022749 RepID=UPI0025CCBAFB|nr:flagellar basal body-associated protein FliL [Sulfurimonas sp.]MCK9491378.1 flagellar basal body-associated protein FliL [Sulfurimonas sp.]
MAEEENIQDTVTEKKSNNMLIIVIIVVLVLIIIVGAIVAFMLMGNDNVPANNQVAPQTNEKRAPSTRQSSDEYSDSRKLNDIGILYPLDTFTVNLKSDSGRRYLKVTMSLELEGKELSMELDNKSPVIRDRVIRILTSKSLEEISSKKGKQKVSDQIMETLNAMTSDGRIKGIYFTEFVVQ